MRRRWAFLRRTEGIAAIEFAMIAFPFLIMTVGVIQMGIVLLTQNMIETAVEAVSRKLLTGSVQQSAMTQSQFVTMTCGLLPPTLNCYKLIINVNVASNFSAASTTRPNLSGIGSPSSTTVLNYNPGAQGRIVVVQLIYALPVVALPVFNLQSTTGINYAMATSVVKNEAYQ